MPSILVTGGAGFIGGNFIRHLLATSDYRVVNLDKLTYAGSIHGDLLRDSRRHIFVQGDIANQELVHQLLVRYECQSIVNFAAETHVDRSIGDPGSFIRTNVLGTFELLEASLKYWNALDGARRQNFRFLHVSTDEVYGSLPAEGLFTETTPYAPNSPYSASKASSDHFVRAYHHTYGLPVLTTNCSNNYGPYQFPEKLIPLIILNIFDQQPLPVYGTGSNIRDWLYVGDHCGALATVLARGQCGEVYNIGGNCEQTNLDVVTCICNTVDRLFPEIAAGRSVDLIRFVTDRPGHDFRYAIDASKIQRELGWSPKVDFASGIEQTIRWYRDNAELIDSWRADFDPRKRLGLRTLDQAAKPNLVPAS